MQYRESSHLESLTRLLLIGLTWAGVVGIAWYLFKPGGWLYRFIDFILRNQPSSYYYLAIGTLALFAVKAWLDRIFPRAFRNLLTAGCACVGTFFILRLLLRI